MFIMTGLKLVYWLYICVVLESLYFKLSRHLFLYLSSINLCAMTLFSSIN